MNQNEMAEHFNVSATTVSRWKYGIQEPSEQVQAGIRALIFKDCPYVAPEMFRKLPTVSFVHHYENLLECHAVTDVLAEGEGLKPEDYIGRSFAEVSKKDRSGLKRLKEIQAHPDWKSGKAVGFDTTFRDFVTNEWCRAVGLILPVSRFVITHIGEAKEQKNSLTMLLPEDMDSLS